jgi:pyridoxine 5-phosphate synthase
VPGLSVNIDHIATIRQARRGSEPDPVAAAAIAEIAGARGIIAHLREDRRHVQDRDLRLLRDVVQTMLNMEMAATEEMQRIAREIKPDFSTLVPEKREELTTEGGLEVASRIDFMKSYIDRLKEAGITVSLFVDPDEKQIAAARRAGADWVELHTGSYANALAGQDREREFVKLSEAAKLAASLGLRVGAGHGLNYVNVARIAGMPEVEELNIGHSIISRAALVGMDRAVRDMRALIEY